MALNPVSLAQDILAAIEGPQPVPVTPEAKARLLQISTDLALAIDRYIRAGVVNTTVSTGVSTVVAAPIPVQVVPVTGTGATIAPGVGSGTGTGSGVGAIT